MGNIDSCASCSSTHELHQRTTEIEDASQQYRATHSCEDIEDGPQPLVLVSDPGQDLDDEMTFILLRHLVETELCCVKGIITTLAPAFDRARLCRGTLDVLGLFGVPIGVGSDGGDVVAKHKASTFVEWARPYMPPRYSAPSDAFNPGRMVLHDLYMKAKSKSLTLVIIAALKDPAIFLRDEEELFVAKTREVVIMGGVEPWMDGAEIVLVPDTANNNTFDMDAARYFYRRCQELGVRLVIVSRWAAYAAKVPRACYDELAATGSWIGCRLRNAQRESIEALWARAACPAGSEGRQGLPDRCDRAWFLKTFCDGASASGRGGGDTIWDLVSGFMPYDPVATVAAIPHLREEYFSPASVTGLHGVNHLVIGRTEEDHGIKNKERLSWFLKNGFTQGLAYNHHRKTQFILLLQPRWTNRAENLLLFVIFRALFEKGIFDCAGIVLHALPDKAEDMAKRSSINLEEFAMDTVKELGLLGLSHVPVHVAEPLDSRGSSGLDHLRDLYKKATPAGISLVVTGSLDLAADFAEHETKAFVQKTQQLILVGGAYSVPEKTDAGAPTGGLILRPDPGAQNNALDMESAERLFLTAQKKLVPLVIVSRHFANTVNLPRSLFDVLANQAHGGEIGKLLYDNQRSSVMQLWKAVHASKTEFRRDLPDRCDRNWFVETFCSGKPPASDSDDDVWKSISSFNIYNVHAILMALPPVFNRCVKGTPVRVRSIVHRIVGSSSEEPGVVYSAILRGLIFQCLVMGTRLNASVFDFQDPPPIQLHESHEGPDWCFDNRNEALNWLLPMERQHSLASLPSSGDLWSDVYR